MATADRDGTPPAERITRWVAQLQHYAPFAQMLDEHVARFVSASSEVAYAPGAAILGPGPDAPSHLWCICQGHVTGRRADEAAGDAGAIELEPGDMFPAGAVVAERGVNARYSAHDAVVCLQLPRPDAQALARDSAPFGDFLRERIRTQLDLSRQARQASYAAQALTEQALEAALGDLDLKTPIGVAPGTALQDALQAMHTHNIGSILVVDAAQSVRGILTRHDILDRVTLARVSLDQPIDTVMSTPVFTLTVRDSAQDAALLMSRHAVRHVPVTREGRVVGIVSERDLFAMQRMSIKHVSAAIRKAPDQDALLQAAGRIREFARHLIGHGVAAHQLTQLISHLNDLLTERLVHLQARIHGVDMDQACWLAFGSEGRSEQTISTDQDNGLVFTSDDPARDRPRWLQFARSVNEALDACGYPLCKGNIMASNPQCCLTPREWSTRFADWLEHGAPEDLLKANIYFDLRPLAGRLELAAPLRAQITRQAAALPRFAKQMADNALRHRVPLNWRGAIDTKNVDGRAMVDLKHHATAVFVDIARLYALALGVPDTGTRARLEAIAPLLHVAPADSQAWVAAFEFLQMLRLQVQMTDTPLERANLVELASLNNIDRHILKESLRVARRLMQKIGLDYQA